ncbi:MAG: hypothetical protein SGJ27_29920 [Candidatus Melainabacteria bacterium]|nr:hypothetical protein [Candidatus Melainabacteria bacterium]
MSDCCKDDTCTPGTISTPSDCFDDCRLSLSREDFQKIDTNNSGSLTTNELKSAQEFGSLGEAKAPHLNCITKTVDNSDVDVQLNGSKVKLAATLPSWHTTDFAQQQLSNEDFKIIDTNSNRMLDSDELKQAAGKGSTLNKMDKHAASILAAHLDASLNDPLLSLKGEVKNWHERSILKKSDDAAAAKADQADKVPGIELNLEENVSVSKVDDQGRPTVIETDGGVHRLKYDEGGRVTEMESDYGMPDSKPWKISYSYDDAARTQTIDTHEGNRKTVNQLDKEGNVVREDHTFQNGNTSTTLFDGQGRITSQINSDKASGKVEFRVEYGKDGERVTSASYRYGENGKKSSDSIHDYRDNSTMTVKYGKNLSIQSVTSIATENGKRVTLETSWNGAEPTHTQEFRTKENSRLVDSIIERDAEDKVVGEARAQWKKMMDGSTDMLEGIEYKDSSGETKILNIRSTGEDGVRFQNLQNQIMQHTHFPTEFKLVPQEPAGKRYRRIFYGNPA